MYKTKIDLSEKTRRNVIAILNDRLADAIDLQSQVKQAHWNVKGPNFIALHELFDKISDLVLEQIDTIAERVTSLGGTAEGTVVETLTYMNGKEVNNLKLTFVGGKLTSMTGSGPGFEDLKKEYDARGDGKELFGFVDFGINPNLHVWPAKTV